MDRGDAAKDRAPEPPKACTVATECASGQCLYGMCCDSDCHTVIDTYVRWFSREPTEFEYHAAMTLLA